MAKKVNKATAYHRVFNNAELYDHIMEYVTDYLYDRWPKTPQARLHVIEYVHRMDEAIVMAVEEGKLCDRWAR